MKKPRAILFFALIATVVVIVKIATAEPHYRGRALTSWLQQCSDMPMDETQRLAEARQAVCAMPRDQVLPRLLQMIETREDTVSPWIIAKCNEFHLHFLKWRSAEDLQLLGIAGFEALGTNASPALTELTDLLRDPGHAFTAVRCLVYLRQPAEPSMCQALTNANPRVRQFAAQQLFWVSDDAETFVAHLTNSLNDPDGNVRFEAIQGIGAQTQCPDLVIPILIRTLERQDGNISAEAASALAGFGTNAMRAFVVLSNAAVSGNFSATAYQAMQTLATLAPERALPIVLQNFHCADRDRRHGALLLLCRYPLKNPAIRSAIEEAVRDEDPKIAEFARNWITGQYRDEHSVNNQFPNDPTCGGKTLGQWLEFDRNPDGSFREDVHDAIVHMGTNAIPGLLARLVYVEPPYGLRTPEAIELNVRAICALIALGRQAIPALPQLQALMDSTNSETVRFAMIASSGTGSNAISLFLKGMTNRFADVRNEAAANMTEGVGAQFPDLRRQAIPLFMNLLNDPDEDVRMNATNQLKEIAPEAAARAGIK